MLNINKFAISLNNIISSKFENVMLYTHTNLDSLMTLKFEKLC